MVTLSFVLLFATSLGDINKQYFLTLNAFLSKMKKQTENTVTVIRTTDDTFVQSLNNIHIKEIVPETIERAKDDATQNLPAPETKSSIHFDFLTARYNRMVTDYKSHVQRNHEQYHANKDITEYKNSKRKLSDDLNNLKNELRVKQRTFENLKSFRQEMANSNKAIIGIILLTCSEAIFASASFQILVENLLFSLIIGASFAISLFYSATIGARILKLAKNTMQFIGIFSAILLIIGIVFYTLGYFRLIYLNEMADAGQANYDLSPIQFSLIQLFFYCCAISLKYIYMLEKHEVDQYNNWKEAKQGVSELEKQKRAIEDELHQQEVNLKQSLITRKTLISHAADVELKINSLYQEAYQQYIKANLHYRSDRKIPACFEQKDILPKLTLYFQDEELLKFNEDDLSYE